MPALLVGCFAPDFAYFFALSPRGLAAHSLHGMFLYDLPLSLVTLWLFYTFARRPFVMILPKGFRARLNPAENGFSFWPPARLALVVVSILVGTATHILWDSFTHPFYWPYRHLSFLRQPVYLPIEGDVHVYKVLQDASSVFGLALVLVWIWMWYRATRPRGLQNAEFYTRAQIFVIRMVVPGLALAGGVLKAYSDMGIPDIGFRPILHFAVITGIAATSLLAVGLLICGAVLRKRVAVTEPA